MKNVKFTRTLYEYDKHNTLMFEPLLHALSKERKHFISKEQHIRYKFQTAYKIRFLKGLAVS